MKTTSTYLLYVSSRSITRIEKEKSLTNISYSVYPEATQTRQYHCKGVA